MCTKFNRNKQTKLKWEENLNTVPEHDVSYYFSFIYGIQSQYIFFYSNSFFLSDVALTEKGVVFVWAFELTDGTVFCWCASSELGLHLKSSSGVPNNKTRPRAKTVFEAPSYIKIEGEDNIRLALKKGRGAIILGAHFGSFEILRAGLATREGLPPLNVLMFIDNAANTNQIFQMANEQGVRLIPLGRPDSLLQAVECLQRGEMVGILGDRTLGKEKIVHVPFLGGHAAFPQAPWILASLSGAPVTLFFGAYQGENRYTILFEDFADAIDVPRAQRTECSAVYATRYAARLADQCRRSPYNWFNFYAFWSNVD